MRHFPAWGWSVITIVVIVGTLFFGAGGPAGRALSRSLYWPVVSVTLVTTLFSYLDQHRRPTKKLDVINIGAVVLVLYVTLPLWHFGIELPTEFGKPPVVHWWINLVVLAAAVVLFLLLHYVTRPLQPGNHAVEDKRERLTV
jgi:hypothetical protein